MRVGVAGKGGSGKTTIAALIAEVAARRGTEVVALDADTNPNLGLALGLALDEVERLVAARQALDAGAPHPAGVDELLQRFGTATPAGPWLVQVSRIDAPLQGCPCCGLNVGDLLAEIGDDGRLVIADLEQGVGSVGRLQAGQLDRLVVVAEPYVRSVEVARRVRKVAAEVGIDQQVFVVNRSDSTDPLRELGAVIAIPDDPTLLAAEREGRSPVAYDPNSTAAIAAERLLDLLLLEPSSVLEARP